jgi:hypothetical protein
MWDGWFIAVAHLAPGAAHIVGLLAYAAVAYGIVLALGGALSTVAKLPLLNIVNALLGAVVGAIKSAAFVWVILYVVLFFPLPAALRHDIHRSALAQTLLRPSDAVDARLRASIPDVVRPFGDQLFAQHRR